MSNSFRDAAWRLSNARLRTEKAARLIYTMIGAPLDMIAESVDQAVRARFPEQCPDDALPYHARDRGIRRGPLEPRSSFVARLLLWLEAWRGAGVGRAMLDQIAGFLTPRATRIRLWSQVGLVYTLEADGTFSVARATRGLWNWDDRDELWARFWIIIDSVWDRDGTWGDGALWGESLSETWGSTATLAEVQTIRAIVDDWKPAASVCKNIIVSFDPTAFSPLDTSPPLPDGTWGPPYKIVGGVAVPNRDDRALYWAGVA